MTTPETNITTAGKSRDEAQAKSTSVDELADRLSHVGGVDDDTAVFIAKNWQKILGALVVTLLFAVLVQAYNTNKSRRLGEASARFNTATEEYRNLLAADEKPLDDAAKAARENNKRAMLDGLDIIRDNYSRSTYAELSELYLASSLAADGKFDEAQKALSKYSIAPLKTVTAAKNAKEAAKSQLVDELAAIQFARIAMRKNPPQVAEAKEILRGLAYAGKFLNLEALLALFRNAQTAEENAEVLTITKALFTARPEIREMVTSQLAAEGFAVQ